MGAPDSSHECEPVELGHPHVADDQVYGATSKQGERLLAISRLVDAVSALGELLSEDLPDGLPIVHHQYTSWITS